MFPFTFSVEVVITTAGVVVELEFPITVVPDVIVTLAAVVLVAVVAVVVIVNSPPADILPHVDMLPLLALAVVSVLVRLIAPAELIGPTRKLPLATCSVTELPPFGLPWLSFVPNPTTQHPIDPTFIFVGAEPPLTPTLVPFSVPTPPVTCTCPAVVGLKFTAPPVATIPLVLAPITTLNAFPAFESLL